MLWEPLIYTCMLYANRVDVKLKLGLEWPKINECYAQFSWYIKITPYWM